MALRLRVGDDGSHSAEEVTALTARPASPRRSSAGSCWGTYALSSGYYDAYYGQAQKVRTLIIRDFDAAFQKVDVLVSPTTPTTASRSASGGRPDGDVPGRPVHHPDQPGRERRYVRALRTGPEDGLAGRLPDHRAAAAGRPALPGRGRPGGRAARPGGGARSWRRSRRCEQEAKDKPIVKVQEQSRRAVFAGTQVAGAVAWPARIRRPGPRATSSPCCTAR